MCKFEELDKRKTSEVESSLTEKFLKEDLLRQTIENREDNISRTTATASNSTILEGGSEEGTYSSPVEFCILVSDSIVKMIESASSDSGAAS